LKIFYVAAIWILNRSSLPNIYNKLVSLMFA